MPQIAAHRAVQAEEFASKSNWAHIHSAQKEKRTSLGLWFAGAHSAAPDSFACTWTLVPICHMLSPIAIHREGHSDDDARWWWSALAIIVAAIGAIGVQAVIGAIVCAITEAAAVVVVDAEGHSSP
ncbi:hypothetical protein TYRP_021646 [Tyrophagus putrescentiae]|nr:hypothetical protein TYRP_021646 [Tyrophagus putrescentiae]